MILGESGGRKVDESHDGDADTILTLLGPVARSLSSIHEQYLKRVKFGVQKTHQKPFCAPSPHGSNGPTCCSITGRLIWLKLAGQTPRLAPHIQPLIEARQFIKAHHHVRQMKMKIGLIQLPILGLGGDHGIPQRGGKAHRHGCKTLPQVAIWLKTGLRVRLLLFAPRASV